MNAHDRQHPFHVEHISPTFAKWCHRQQVSCETLAQLNIYYQLLKQWNKCINLVSPSSLADFWDRHVLNSAALLPYIQESVIDIGSGAGFPAIVLAILGVKRLTLVEANRKKAIFLTHVISHLHLDAQVICGRAELQQLAATTITSRACAKIDQLLTIVKDYQYDQLLLLKGQSVTEEISQAQNNWHFQYRQHPNEHTSVLSISKVQSRHD